MTFRILAVCTANICRSPLAAMLLSQTLGDEAGVEVASAGMRAMVGREMPPQLQLIASSCGIDPTAHRGQQVDQRIVQDADLILAMAREHRRDLVEQYPMALRRTFTLKELARVADEFAAEATAVVASENTVTAEDRMRAVVAFAASMRGAGRPLTGPADLDVADPYGGPDEGYRVSFEEIYPAVMRVAHLLSSAAEA